MARLVVIDDDRSVRILIEKGLAKHGHEIELVSSGNGGLAALHEFQPDVVLLDLLLDGESGLTGVIVESCVLLK